MMYASAGHLSGTAPDEAFDNDADNNLNLCQTITRGVPGIRKDFATSLVTPHYDESGEVTGRKVDLQGRPRPMWDDSPYIGIPALGNDEFGDPKSIQSVMAANKESFRIPKYEAWHGQSQATNPYKHYLFPIMANGFLTPNLGTCEDWTQVMAPATSMKYNTEHVFEVQQLKGFFSLLVTFNRISGNNDMVKLLFDPENNPVRTWPFCGSEKTSLAQLLADCLPNHTLGKTNSDFVYLEARINRAKGAFFYDQFPKAFKHLASGEIPSGLTQLQELWTALATTMLTLGYLNNEVVVTKYNHVSRRIRMMLEAVAHQSRVDRDGNQQWDLWNAWQQWSSEGRLIKEFNAYETTFLHALEWKIRSAITKAVDGIILFHSEDKKELEFQEWCKMQLAGHPYTKVRPSMSLSLHRLTQTQVWRDYGRPQNDQEAEELQRDLVAYVSSAEPTQVEVMEKAQDEDDESEIEGSAEEPNTNASNWQAQWVVHRQREESYPLPGRYDSEVGDM